MTRISPMYEDETNYLGCPIKVFNFVNKVLWSD